MNDITNINALIGKNSTGKTNILTAIEWASSVAVSVDNVEWEVLSNLGNNTEFLFEIKLDGILYRYNLVVTYSLYSTEDLSEEEFTVSLKETISKKDGPSFVNLINRIDDEVKVTGWDYPLEIEINSPCIRLIQKLLPKIEISKDLEKIVTFFSSINYYSLDEFNDRSKKTDHSGYVKHSDYSKWLSRFKSSAIPAKSVAMRLLHMYLEKEEEGGFHEVKELLGMNGLGLIKDISINTFTIPSSDDSESEKDIEKLYFFYFQPLNSSSEGAGSFRYHDLSFGTKRLMRMVISLIYDRSSIFLLEQPEDGIHPGLLHKLIPLLRSYSDNAQFIVASHSPDVLNRLSPSEIRLVTMVKGVTKLRRLSKNELEVVCDYIKEEGALSDFVESIQED